MAISAVIMSSGRVINSKPPERCWQPKIPRLESLAPARIHWSMAGGATTRDPDTCDTRLGVHVADLPTSELSAGAEVVFTHYWPQEERWEGNEFLVRVVSRA